MTIWRPPARIRFKAIGLHWRGDALLAVEVLDDAGRVKGVRPPGGTVEFGETARDALARELREELDVEATPIGPPLFMENLYIHEGAPGHEVLAIFDVAFPPGAFAHETRIDFREDDGAPQTARWFPLGSLDLPGAPRLYPDGLKDRLTRDGRG